jgi:hypothetical protein
MPWSAWLLVGARITELIFGDYFTFDESFVPFKPMQSLQATVK